MSYEGWRRDFRVGTNALLLGLLIANVEVEVDLCKHWSAALPVSYSAWNYFSSTVKFRTLSFRPEFRYWFSNKKNDGFFVGAHFGFVYFNLAVNGDCRFQDHDGKSPAYGGGFSLGYRLPLGVRERWNVEFSIGAGAYSVHYDKFRNELNGLRVSSARDIYFGIDHAAITFSYSFFKKKGGRK